MVFGCLVEGCCEVLVGTFQLMLLIELPWSGEGKSVERRSLPCVRYVEGSLKVYFGEKAGIGHRKYGGTDAGISA